MIRAVQDKDAEAIAAIYAPYVKESAFSFEIVPPSAEEMKGRIQEVTTYAPWLVYEVNGQVAGYAYASKHRARHAYQWSLEVSCYLHPSFQRQGLGRQLYEELFRRVAEQGYHLVLAGITLPNDASVKFHESMGFLPVGVFPGLGFKQGKWHDVGWWQKRLQPIGTAPKPLHKP